MYMCVCICEWSLFVCMYINIYCGSIDPLNFVCEQRIGIFFGPHRVNTRIFLHKTNFNSLWLFAAP